MALAVLSLGVSACGDSTGPSPEPDLDNATPTVALEAIAATAAGKLTIEVRVEDPDVDPRVGLNELAVEVSGPVTDSKTLSVSNASGPTTLQVEFTGLPFGSYTIRAVVDDAAGASAAVSRTIEFRDVDLALDMVLYRLEPTGNFAPVPEASMVFGLDTVPVVNGQASVPRLSSVLTTQKVSFSGQGFETGYLVCQFRDHDGVQPNIINTTAFNAAPQVDSMLAEGVNERNCIVFDSRLNVAAILEWALWDTSVNYKWAFPGDTLVVRLNTVANAFVGGAEHAETVYSAAEKTITEVMDYFRAMPGEQHIHSTIERNGASRMDELYRDGELSIVPTAGQTNSYDVDRKPGTQFVHTGLSYIWNVEGDLIMDEFYLRQAFWRIFAGFNGWSPDPSSILYAITDPARYRDPNTEPTGIDWAVLGFFRSFDAATAFKEQP